MSVKGSNREFGCTWIIMAPEDNMVRVSYSRLDGYLTLRDGKSESSAVLVKSDSSTLANKWWTSSGQYLRISYKAARVKWCFDSIYFFGKREYLWEPLFNIYFRFRFRFLSEKKN